MGISEQQEEALGRYAAIGDEFTEAGISIVEKEVAAVAISVAAGCRPCTLYHLRAARECGTGDAAIEQAVRDGLAARHEAASSMQDFCEEKLHRSQAREPARKPDAETNAKEGGSADGGNGRSIDPSVAAPDQASQEARARALSALGAAAAVNCTPGLRQALDNAVSAGISLREVELIGRLAAFIRAMAAGHVDKMTGAAREAASEDKDKEGRGEENCRPPSPCGC